jgi:putative endonuclease
MHYTYVLPSEADGKRYTGATADLRQRLRLHSAGRIRSTAYMRPLTLVSHKACSSADDSFRRERCLRSGRGVRYPGARLASSFADIRRNKLERH